MKYVLDSCVALKWVLPEPQSAIAIRLRNSYHLALDELLAPDVFSVEVLHALTRAERQKRLQPGDGWPLWQSILGDLPTLHGQASLLKRAYEISSSVRIGIYDCLYVALAERERCDLITADQKLVNTLRGSFSFVISLGSLP